MAHAGWCPVRCYIAHAIDRQHLVHHLNTTPHGPINGQQVLVDCFDVPARHVIVGTQLSSRPLSDVCLCACAMRTASATDIAYLIKDCRSEAICLTQCLTLLLLIEQVTL